MRWAGLSLLCFLMLSPVGAQGNPTVTAIIINAGGVLRHWPDPSGPVVTLLNEGTAVVLSARDERSRWFYAQTLTGLAGWLPSHAMGTTQDTSVLPILTSDDEFILDRAQYWNFEPHLHSLYNTGLTRGNRPDFFTHVGDSISVSNAFLRPFGNGVYALPPEEPHLQFVIDYFSQARQREDRPFLHRSRAAGVGWTTRDLLRTNLAEPCLPRETRIACEYRLNQPAFALILVGTNDAGFISAGEYETNLRRIVDETLAKSIIPVLSTLPTQRNLEGRIREFNLAIVRIAEEYDIPLWNYWLGLQALPNYGIGRDGIHPSSPADNAGTTIFEEYYLQFGYTLRNLMALRVLHLLLFNVVYVEA